MKLRIADQGTVFLENHAAPARPANSANRRSLSKGKSKCCDKIMSRSLYLRNTTKSSGDDVDYNLLPQLIYTYIDADDIHKGLQAVARPWLPWQI